MNINYFFYLIIFTMIIFSNILTGKSMNDLIDRIEVLEEKYLQLEARVDNHWKLYEQSQPLTVRIPSTTYQWPADNDNHILPNTMDDDTITFEQSETKE